MSCCGWGVVSLVYSAERVELDLDASDYMHAAQVGKVARDFVDMIEKECGLPMGKVRSHLEEALGANSLAKEAHDKVEVIEEIDHCADARRHMKGVVFELENTLKNACLEKRR